MAKKLIAHSTGTPIEIGADGALPTEFLICKAGENKSQAGDFIFTAKSAASVLQEAAARKSDGNIDLQHYSLPDCAKGTINDDDAMGSFTPEVRADGSLWAVNVRWSEEGARRLRMKLQRFISPVVFVDKQTSEVVGLWNLALVSEPAMLDAAPLVAASKRLLQVSIAARRRAEQFLKNRKGQHGSQSAR